MGAETFATRAKGKNAREAFVNAREDAQHEHGHGGYSGTIAEKTSFKEVKTALPIDQVLNSRVELTDLFPGFDDKWGPAGALKIADGEWLFFGVASS